MLEFTLADRLRKAREFAGLEQRELAEALGIHRQSVARYEKGDAEPRLPVLRTWAMETGVDLEWLEAGMVRPEGFEPPTFWSVVTEGARCGCIGYHARGDCPVGCGCGWCAPELWDAAFWSIVCQAEFDTESTHTLGLA